MDEVVSPDLGALVYDQVRRFVVSQATTKSVVASDEGAVSTSGSLGNAEGPPELMDERFTTELATLDRAYSQKVLYIVGKEQMRVRIGTRILRRVFLGAFLWMRDNTRTKVANLRLTMEKIIEVGFVKEV